MEDSKLKEYERRAIEAERQIEVLKARIEALEKKSPNEVQSQAVVAPSAELISEEEAAAETTSKAAFEVPLERVKALMAKFVL
jgi:hypothetical protein